MPEAEMVLRTEKCTERNCGTRVRYSELTDAANTHWHVRKGVALEPLTTVIAPANRDGVDQ